MTDLLTIDDLTGGYGDTHVVFDITARVRAGQVLGVFGRNGVGKTTLARLIQGSLGSSQGRIMFKGREIEGLEPHERRRMGLGYMPQTGMVFDDLTVWENLTLGKTARAPDAYFDRFPRLAERRDQPAGTMSGGERKVLAFVRTMIEDTTFLVLDEPSEGVQPENIDHMAECLRSRVAEGAGVILFEQNIPFLADISDHYLGLDTGRIVMDRAKGAVSIDDIRAVLAL